MVAPTLPFSDVGIGLADIGISETAFIAALLLGSLAGILAGKQEHDAAVAKGDTAKQNEGAKDWLEDAGWGVVGSFIGVGLGLQVWLLPIAGYASKRLIPLMADRLIDMVQRAFGKSG